MGIWYSALTMVVRDHLGNLVFLASFICNILDPTLAKLKALEWANSFAFEFG